MSHTCRDQQDTSIQCLVNHIVMGVAPGFPMRYREQAFLNNGGLL